MVLLIVSEDASENTVKKWLDILKIQCPLYQFASREDLSIAIGKRIAL